MTHLGRPLLGSIALIGLITSFSVHISALLGSDVASHFPHVWLLHVGMFVVFIPFVLIARHDFGSQPSLTQVAAVLPRWAKILGICIFAYAIINFFLFLAGTGGGTPEAREGKFFLLNHGKLIREITAAEYAALRANEVRGFSGHWLVFYFVPAVYLLLGWKSNNSFKPNPLRGSA